MDMEWAKDGQTGEPFVVQAPSDYPEFAQFLVQQGSDNISLNPDAVLKTTVAMLDMEKQR